MVSRAASLTAAPAALGWLRGYAPLPGGWWGTLLVAAACVGLAVGAAALPLVGALALGIGLPVALITIAHPRIALVLLLFSIPFSSWVKLSAGNFDVNSTDALVALLILGWALRGFGGAGIVLRGGPIIIAALVLFGSAYLSSLTAMDFPDALKELIKLAEMIAVAVYAASRLGEPDELRFTLLALLAAGTCEALLGLRQFVTRSGPDFFALGPFMRAYGDFGQPNALAGYLGMVFPFALALCLRPAPERRLVLLATAIIAAAIGATWSRGAWLGIIAGLAVMALMWSGTTRRALALGVGIVSALIALGLAGLLPDTVTERVAVLFENFVVFDVRYVDPTSVNWSLVERMAHWQAGLDMGMDHPFLGVGPGNYEAAYPRYQFRDWLEPLGHAHNYYINTFAEMGIIGLVAFLGFTITIFVRLVRALGCAGTSPTLERIVLVAALGAAVTLSVHNTFDNMFVHGIGVQFGLLLGLAEAAAITVTQSAAASRETTSARRN